MPKARGTARPASTSRTPRTSWAIVVVLIPPPVLAGAAPTAIRASRTHWAVRGSQPAYSSGWPSVRALTDSAALESSAWRSDRAPGAGSP